MTADLSSNQLLLAMFGQTVVLLGACVAVIKILAKRPDRPAVAVPAIPPTNGATKEVLETKLQSLRELTNQKFDQHERRITKHQEELREEIDVINLRLDALSKK